MNKRWFEVSCKIPFEHADNVAMFLTELSGNGVCTENLQVDAFSTSEIPQSPMVSVSSYFCEPPDAARYMEKIKVFLKNLEVANHEYLYVEPTVTIVQTEDWSNSWKVNFKPLRVGKRILIVPTWEEATPRDGDCVLRIDPGMAFGTGGHETTRLCLELLEEIVDASPIFTIPSLLDLGTGSGILAMAAVGLGCGDVWGVDIDPDAVEVARENIALNDLSEQIRCDTTPLESINREFDIILANILAEELVRLAPQLIEKLADGAALVLSGILAEKEGFVRDRFKSYPLQFIKTLHAGEWVAIQYKKVCQE